MGRYCSLGSLVLVLLFFSAVGCQENKVFFCGDVVSTDVTRIDCPFFGKDEYNLKIKSLEPLKNFDDLQELDITRQTHIDNLGPIKGLIHLIKLRIGNTNVSDLAAISGLKNIEHLSIEGTKVADISPIASLTKLRNLSLKDLKISDISPLKNLIKMESLGLQYTQVSDLTPLSGMKNLLLLELTGTNVKDLSPLGDLKNLQSVIIFGGDVNREDMQALANKLPKLRIESSYGVIKPEKNPKPN